ncbi:hypothetical protein [Frigidibacter sp. ROC022]|uniref:hypothetical protein n=1 Tax=Frigidibacter sp. ROC022 TaxID=2971796 RepID=UPI00215AA78F|nr:hypothetical protein [Frigidibacter sp. ROC022]MCR8723644.1 hypothetical protein [Frigidibacter sp. ROC022]
MKRPNPVLLFGLLAAALALIGGMELLKGGVFIAKHEGDTLHLLDIVSRMADGQRIHQDFMTPIGVLAFAPIVAVFAAGATIGKAMILAQIGTALVLLPAIWWVAQRLPRLAAYLVGLYLVVLCMALTYGGTEVTLSMSMHYNRWAWVLAYLALLPALVPARARRRAETLDGLVIGLAMAALVLLKITYFMALLLPVVVSLAMLNARRTLLTAFLAGVAVALVVTLWGGPAFWLGYIGDLRTVAESPLRTQPGLPIGNLMGAPSFLPINILLLLSVVLMRQAHRGRVGLVLLLLLPSMLYIELQNFGNDPQWLVLLGVLLMTLRPGAEMVNGWGWNLRNAFNLTAAAVMAFAAPSVLNLGYSPWRHLWLDTSDYVAMIPNNPRYGDLGLPQVRYARADGKIPLDGEGSGLDHLASFAERDKDEAELSGEPLRSCGLEMGIEGVFDAVAGDLKKAGFEGRRIFEADLFNALWLFGDFPPLIGAAPWYYGGTPGMADADLVLVPECAVSLPARKTKLDAISEAGYVLAPIRETPLYTLYSVTPPG